MSYYGIAAFNKERTKLFCIAHNLTTEKFSVIWDDLSRKKAAVIHFIHAMDHTGPAPECAGCIAAIEEGMAIAAEEDERERRRSTPEGEIRQGPSPTQILGGTVQNPLPSRTAQDLPSGTQTSQAT
jgi:hypothetical protein